MADTKLLKYYTCRKIIKLVLLCVGSWPLEDPYRFYYILPYIQLFLQFGISFAILGYVRVHFENIALVTKGLSVMTSFLTAILKVLCITVNRKDVHELYKNLDPHFDKMLNDPNLKNTILKGITTYHFLAWATISFIMTTGVVYVSVPIIFIVYQHIHRVESIQYMLPYPAIYPWPISSNGILYKCHYTFEILASVSLSLTALMWKICTRITANESLLSGLSSTFSFEPLFALYVFQMIGQIREMAHRLLNTDKISEAELRQCVVQYTRIMKCRDILQKIYGPIILWMMAINAIILCTLMFQLTQMKTISVGKIVLFSAYIGVKLMQTFIYAWSGTQLTAESADYLEAVYSANWYGSKRSMTSVLIMLAQKPLTLTACNFSVVSLDIFKTVVNAAISYLFLLQTLDDAV